MKFEDTKGKAKWYDGASYNGMTKNYGVYFPRDKQTVATYLDDEDLELKSETVTTTHLSLYSYLPKQLLI